jgi:hypothetical protein
MYRARVVGLVLALVAILLCTSFVSASGEYAFAFANTQGTNFYGSCVEYQGTTGKFAWSIFSDNNSPTYYEFYAFQGTGDVHQWQANAAGYRAGHLLKTQCVVYDGNYNQIAYAEASRTVPP